jgi:CheY-like chemotaxis protein
VEGDGVPCTERGAQVLIADDVTMNRKMVKRCLQQLGFCCDEATDGAEAVARCQVKRYCLVRGRTHICLKKTKRHFASKIRAAPLRARSSNKIQRHSACTPAGTHFAHSDVSTHPTLLPLD